MMQKKRVKRQRIPVRLNSKYFKVALGDKKEKEKSTDFSFSVLPLHFFICQFT